jgi:hypothetical protein
VFLILISEGVEFGGRSSVSGSTACKRVFMEHRRSVAGGRTGWQVMAAEARQNRRVLDETERRRLREELRELDEFARRLAWAEREGRG